MALLEIRDLTKSYDQIKALEGFSLDVPEGCIFALVGPDGAGKTSMIRIICNLLKADGGQVRIEGRDVFTEFERIKQDVGYMPQVFSLYPDLSVEENLVFYAGIFGLTGTAYRHKRDQLYDFSNLGPFAGRRAGALSGGMKQKLALSCALVHDPRILILDEPTTGVDPLSRRQFWEILAQLRAQGVTILVSTPYMDEVARADRACFILDGRKLSEGTPESLAREFEGVICFLNREPTRELVQALNAIAGLSASRFGAGLHLYLAAGDDILNYRTQLSTIGVGSDEVSPITPELEDRFIQLMEQM